MRTEEEFINMPDMVVILYTPHLPSLRSQKVQTRTHFTREGTDVQGELAACLGSWSQAVIEPGWEPSLSDCEAGARTASTLPLSLSPESTVFGELHKSSCKEYKCGPG